MFQHEKPDEMELDIRNKSSIIANVMTEAILLIWFAICMFTKRPAIIPLYILLAQLTAKYISRLILKRHVGDERWKKGSIVFLLVLLAVVFLLLVSGGAA